MISNELLNLDKNLITIIGSGPASLTLAIDLHKKKIPCQILEAGKLSFSKEFFVSEFRFSISDFNLVKL